MTTLSHSYSSLKLFDNCPKRYYHERIARDVKAESGEASLHGERIHKFLEQRLKREADLPQEVEKYEALCNAVERQSGDGQLMLEQELTLNEKLKPTTWFAPDAWLRSKLDVLIVKKETATVMDWKTGKRRPDKFQLRLFAAQVFLHYEDVKKINTSFVWLPDSAMDKETYTRDNLTELLTDVLIRTRRVEQAVKHETWPAKPSGLCRFCPCNKFCEFAV